MVKQGDGQDGWIDIAAEYQLMTIGNGQIWFCPYGVAQFENGEIFMLGDAYHGTAKEEFPAVTFSSAAELVPRGTSLPDQFPCVSQLPLLLGSFPPVQVHSSERVIPADPKTAAAHATIPMARLVLLRTPARSFPNTI